MKTMLIIVALSWAALCPAQYALAAEDDHDHRSDISSDHADDIDQNGSKEATTIRDDNAIASGINTAIAGSGTLSRTVKTYGRVVVPSNQISHIRARFPGLIKNVVVEIGDAVDAGDLLATVEANASLKGYALRAPIKGIVTERHANAGELAQNQVLFSLVNPEQLWAEIRVFEGQLADVRTGQLLSLSSTTQQTQSAIENIMPSLDDHPFVIARAKINNATGIWSPGMFVEGDIVVETVNASLVVNNRALQTLDGQRGIFTQHGERYEFHPLTLGRSDRQFSEVLDGLRTGAVYVVENSYLIKADIEKSGAAHEH